MIFLNGTHQRIGLMNSHETKDFCLRGLCLFPRYKSITAFIPSDCDWIGVQVHVFREVLSKIVCDIHFL